MPDGIEIHEVQEIGVGEFQRNPDDGPSEVHIIEKVHGFQYPMVLRLKSAKAVDDLVVQLITARNAVWPSETSQSRNNE